MRSALCFECVFVLRGEVHPHQILLMATPECIYRRYRHRTPRHPFVHVSGSSPESVCEAGQSISNMIWEQFFASDNRCQNQQGKTYSNFIGFVVILLLILYPAVRRANWREAILQFFEKEPLWRMQATPKRPISPRTSYKLALHPSQQFNFKPLGFPQRHEQKLSGANCLWSFCLIVEMYVSKLVRLHLSL